MATDVKERAARGHTVRTVVFLFLLCVAVCAVFFSMGFMVGFNERGSHSAPAAEVVGTPAAIPPPVNPPPDSGQLASQEQPGRQTAPNGTPETEVIPPEGGVTSAEAKPDRGAPDGKPHSAASKPAADQPAPMADGVNEGFTLQVVALRNKQDAERLVDILKENGYPVFLLTPEFARADDDLFRVLVGPFRSRADADKARDKLVQEGFKPFLRH